MVKDFLTPLPGPTPLPAPLPYSNWGFQSPISSTKNANLAPNSTKKERKIEKKLNILLHASI
jgi:hypothetical protein